MNKKRVVVFFVMIFLFAIIGVANASTTETLTADSGWSSNSQSGMYGVRFVVGNVPIQINSLTKPASSNATMGYIIENQSGVGDVILANASISGNVATFSSPVVLNSSYTYKAVFDGGGASYTRPYKAGAYPINGTYLDYLSNEGAQTSEYTNFISMDVDLSLNVTLNLPQNGYSSSNSTVVFNGTSIISVGNLSNVSLWDDSTGIWERRNTTSISGLSSIDIFTNIYADGTFIWNYETCRDDGICFFSSSNRTFTIDSTGPVISSSYPPSVLNYSRLGDPLQINFSAIDNNLDSCWIDYGGSNNSVVCNNATNTIQNITLTTQKNATIYANDSSGNLGSEFISWDYKIFELNTTYNNPTTEGSYETFTLDLQKGSGFNLQSIVLNYNGTQYSPSLFSSGDSIIAVSQLLIPSVESDFNQTFYFTITLTDSTIFNTTSQVQLIQNINVDNCTINPYPFIYLYLKEEATRAPLNGTIETNIELVNDISFGQVLNFSSEYDGVTNLTLCSSVVLNGTDFLINAEIKYSAINYSKEFYHFQRTNSSETPINISLFDLLLEDTTLFKVIYRGDNLIGVEGAIIQLQRKYISDGVYEVVEAPLTSSESTAILHIDTATNKYQATVIKDGEVLGFFSNLAFICQSELTGECTLDLFDNLVPPNLITLNTLRDFSYYINTSEENLTITINFAVPSGTPSTINVFAEQTSIIGTSVICNQTLVSSAGAVECTYTSSIDDSEISFQVYKDGELVVSKSYTVKDNLLSEWDGNNYFIVIILVLSLSFMAISSPEWMVINAVITLLVSGGIWLVRGMDFTLGIGNIIWLIIAAVILITKMSKQEDR